MMISTGCQVAGYPRVLVVNGEPFNQQSASGYTMRNLFRGWPRERIAQVYTAAMEPETEICSTYWRLRLEDLCLPRSLWRPIASHLGAIMESPRFERDGNSSRAQVTDIRFTSAAKMCLRSEGAACLDLISYRLNPTVLAGLDDFRPELVYSFLGSARIMGLAEMVAKHYRIPIVPHFMDDWPETQYRSRFLAPLLRIVLRQKLWSILKQSSVRLVISNAMAEEYACRYDMTFLAFMNCVDGISEKEQEPEQSKGDSIRIVVLGNLERGRLKLLEDLAVVIANLRDSLPNLELRLYTKPEYQQMALNCNVLPTVATFHNSPTDAEVTQILSEADILIHLESFDAAEVKYFRHSMSAKVPLYLAAGKAILVYGPGNNAVAKYALSANWGCVVDRRERQLLSDTLVRLVNSQDLRCSLGQAAMEASRKYHDASRQRIRFHQVLIEAAMIQTHKSGPDAE